MEATVVEQEIFRKVPFLSNLKCSADGRFFVESTGEEVVSEYSEFYGYLLIKWNGNQYFVHRLVAMAWLPLPDSPFEELQVNHKDGNKLHNDISNLEWVTASQNRLHAIENGLAPATRILRKDLRTGEVVKYLSINECAREVKISPATVLKFINEPNYVRKIYYVFIKEGDKWPELDENDIGKNLRGMPTVVRIKNPENGKEYIGKTVASAAELINVRPDTLYAWMRNNKDSGKTYRGWEVVFETDPAVISKVFAKIPKRVPPENARRKQFGYLVTNTVNNQTRRYPNANEVCSVFGMTRNYLRCIMSRNGGIWKKLKFQYEHKVDAKLSD